ncbi:hypothetical protein CCACVL1_21648 [Corchorus capsularis]|uniref:RRM domain-containing protein n=1 Tax=Corchorus capsularis TaxID=210143 RepID=A0A1R3H2K0_COCAP|nr:hypothetical protein CCACVL1_21648 [Corchorus capsularis]
MRRQTNFQSRFHRHDKYRTEWRSRNRCSLDWRSRLHSVFVGNLHWRATLGILWKTFSDFGVVVDVFIPTRTSFGCRDDGSRFAFVRYKRKEEAEKAIEKGNGLSVGNRSIIVRKATQCRKCREERKIQSNSVETMCAKEGGFHFKSFERSFKEVTTQSQNDARPDFPSEAGLQKNGGLKLDIPNSKLEWLERSAMGILRSPFYYNLIQDSLCRQGIGVAIALMSDIQLLLTFLSKEEMGTFIQDYREMFQTWFDDIIPWKENIVERYHHVWIKVEEVPLLLWHEKFFNEIGSYWGKVLSIAEVTINRKNFTAAWLKLEVANKRSIPSVLEGEINGVKFRVEISIVSENNVPKVVLESSSNVVGEESPVFIVERVQDSEHEVSSACRIAILDEPAVMVVDHEKESEINGRILEEGTTLPIEQHAEGGIKCVNAGGLIPTTRNLDVEVDFVPETNQLVGQVNGPKESINNEFDVEVSSAHNLLDIMDTCDYNKELESCSHVLDKEWTLVNRGPKKKKGSRFQKKKLKKYRKVVADILGRKEGIGELGSDASLSDSDIARKNKVNREEALKTLETCELLGITFEGDREQIIQVLERFEEESQESL